MCDVCCFAVGLHPRRNSNTTSVVFLYKLNMPSTAMQAAARRLINAVGANPRSEEYENIFFIVAATRRHKIAGGVVGYDKNPWNIDYCRIVNPRNTEYWTHLLFSILKNDNILPCKNHSINRFQKTSKKNSKKFGGRKKSPYLCTRKWEKHRRLKRQQALSKQLKTTKCLTQS